MESTNSNTNTNNSSNNNKKSKYENYIEQVDPNKLEEWKKTQNELSQKIILEDNHNWNIQNIKYIGGVDISASKNNPSKAISALVILDKDLNIVYEDFSFSEITEPYVPGFLAFREVSHIYKLIDKLKLEKPEFYPDVILVDGNGVFHPKKFGLACHLGVLCDTCTIGCGKTVLYVDGIDKKKVREISKNKLKKGGDYEYLIGDSGFTYGACFRSHDNCNVPIIISCGHKISLDTSIQVVKMSIKYRVPEPVRLADKISRYLLKHWENLNFTDFSINDYINANRDHLLSNLE